MKKMRVHVRVHSDVEGEGAKKYWSKITGIPPQQFYKTTYKVSSSAGKRFNRLSHGIASIIICDTNLFYKIQGWIEAVALKISKKD